jgi:hypothetical protein
MAIVATGPGIAYMSEEPGFILGLLRNFEDTKRVIIIRKSKQDRHRDGQKKQDKRTNNDLLNTYTSS